MLKIKKKNNIFLPNFFLNYNIKIFISTFFKHGKLSKYTHWIFQTYKSLLTFFSFSAATFVLKFIHFNFDNLLFLIPTEKILFNFEIHKLDKQLRKRTKNKGLRFKFLWKYIPVFKRLKCFLRWLAKELFFSKLLLFKNKLFFYLMTSLISNSNTFFEKNQKFINTFIFKNFLPSVAKQSSKLFSR